MCERCRTTIRGHIDAMLAQTPEVSGSEILDSILSRAYDSAVARGDTATEIEDMFGRLLSITLDTMSDIIRESLPSKPSRADLAKGATFTNTKLTIQ